ncbi:uncharacterized CRM domain-containing protein At3g25440, chloroplastic-like [Selaginella moellendorffii]|uniref:uncharacterized CRM domain-containing protein At3g25440, chloroplastic-like n=1 Tax=Selaginella moellendorffii TaxID=88036 RepID=UPI000D1CFFF0|nr:uncharacterized CRM domain-containing protein At3g25440, chloroplastic-like [Selaginella moellendorffii]|eukprot:XP_024535474.1 uncharacterized CRM domain-containing protein At3g25440, chloroplastic-like [Selaginella moellendorffii]
MHWCLVVRRGSSSPSSLIHRFTFLSPRRSSSNNAGSRSRRKRRSVQQSRACENVVPEEQPRINPWKERRKLQDLQVGRKFLSEDVATAENLREMLKKTYERIELKKKILQEYDFPEDKPVHDPEYLSPEFMTALKERNRCIDDFLTIGKRGVWEGFIRDIYSHWINHETLRIHCEGYPLRKLRPMAEKVARMSGAVVIAVTEETMSFILYRGRNFSHGYQPPSRIENMLNKGKALKKALLLKSLQHLYRNVRELTERIHKHRLRAVYTEKQRKAIVEAEERGEDLQADASQSDDDEEFQW